MGRIVVLALLAVLACGCGAVGPVTEAEFKGMQGYHRDAAIRRLGPPDEHDGERGLIWRNKVVGKDGRPIPRAEIVWEEGTGRVSWVGFLAAEDQPASSPR